MRRAKTNLSRPVRSSSTSISAYRPSTAIISTTVPARRASTSSARNPPDESTWGAWPTSERVTDNPSCGQSNAIAGSQSRTSAGRSSISAKLTYGGLHTIASSFAPASGASNEPWRKWTCDFNDFASDCALAAATSIASSEMSVAKTRANSPSNASERAIAPDPVPISAIARVVAVARSSTRSTRSSVSTRGIRTRSSTWRVRCLKDARPTAYASGAPLARFMAARITALATWGDASATVFAAAQNFGTSSTAATISRASRSGSGKPSASNIEVHPASKSPIVPIGSVVGKYEPPLLLTELLLDVGNFESLDEGVYLSVQNFRQLVKRQIDPMVGDPILRVIISTVFGRAVAGADLGLAHARASSFLLRDFRVEQAGAQNFHRLQLVLQL